MRGTTVVLRGFMAAAALGQGFCSEAKADAIRTEVVFSTSGSIATTGVSGTPLVSFQGASGTLTTGTPFDLGRFVIAAPSAGASTTYTNTPFSVRFMEQSVGGATPYPNQTPVVLDGWLNGTITAGATPHLLANFNVRIFNLEDGPSFPTVIEPFRTGSSINYLNLTNWGQDGQMIRGELNAVQIVPEPASVALFAGIVGVFIRRWHRDVHSRAFRKETSSSD